MEFIVQAKDNLADLNELGANMEAVRRYIDEDSLMTVKKLPEKFRNYKLEVIILPVEEREEVSKRAANINHTLQLLTGVIPYTDMLLEELREERL